MGTFYCPVHVYHGRPKNGILVGTGLLTFSAKGKKSSISRARTLQQDPVVIEGYRDNIRSLDPENYANRESTLPLRCVVGVPHNSRDSADQSLNGSRRGVTFPDRSLSF